MFDWLKRLLFGAQPPRSPFPPGTGPSRLLVIRHAEKTGIKRDKGLSPEGQVRAQRLASYIPQNFGRPDFLIAATNSAKSTRPVETIEPLSEALGLAIEADLDDEDWRTLIERLQTRPRYAGKFGLISWRHDQLVTLLKALGAPEGSYPDPWDPNEFGMTMDLNFSGGVTTLRTVKQPF